MQVATDMQLLVIALTSFNYFHPNVHEIDYLNLGKAYC